MSHTATGMNVKPFILPHTTVLPGNLKYEILPVRLFASQWYVPVCTGMYRYITGIYRYILVHTKTKIFIHVVRIPDQARGPVW